MDRQEQRYRILEEIRRLQNNVHNCAHCASLRAQMARLLNLMPPQPVTINDLRYEYIGPLPENHAWRFSESTVTCMDCGVTRTAENDRAKCPQSPASKPPASPTDMPTSRLFKP